MSRRILFTVVPAMFSGLLACSGSDDAPTEPEDNVVPMISVADRTVAEGNAALFEISLSEVTTRAVTFDYFTSDSTAVAPDDYTSTRGTDTISQSSLSTTVIVPTTDDTAVEQTEVFSFAIASVGNATVADSVATGTILDNDAAVVSYATDVQPLLQINCATMGCHGQGSAQGGLSMGSSADYATIISATGDNTGMLVTDSLVVQPGSSSTSTLYTKTTSSPPFPSRMPPLADPDTLTAEEQQRIRDWIDGGAPDN